MSDSRTFSNDSDFAAEQGRKGGANQPDEIYKREYICMRSGMLAPLTTVFFFFFFAHRSPASEHDGLREDGQPDKRLSSEHGKPPPDFSRAYRSRSC